MLQWLKRDIALLLSSIWQLKLLFECLVPNSGTEKVSDQLVNTDMLGHACLKRSSHFDLVSQSLLLNVA